MAGGNIGTVFVGFAAALTIGLIGWRGAVLALGSVAVVVAIAILIAVREAPPSEADRTAAETPSATCIERCSSTATSGGSTPRPSSAAARAASAS